MRNLTIAVDFDNQITMGTCYPRIGKLRPYAKEILKKCYHLGHTIIINTCRAGDELKDCIKFLNNEGVIYNYINENKRELIKYYGTDTRKISADLYFDDRSTPVDWRQIGIMIEKYQKPTVICIVGESGCMDSETEFFNGYKWKRLSDYNEYDKVLQYNRDGCAELVSPIHYHKYDCEYLWHFKTQYGIDQCLSEEHTVYYADKNENLKSKSFRDVKLSHESNVTGFRGRFLTTFKYNGNGIDLSDSEIRIMCAVICDGSFIKNTRHCRFHIKKDRKKERLRELFRNAKITYREKQSSADGYTDFYIDAPRVEKIFSEYWYNCSNKQLLVICDEVMNWDGSTNYSKIGNKKRQIFSSSIKENADFVQFAFSSCGCRSTIHTNDRRGQEYLTCGKVYTRKSIDYSVTVSNNKFVGISNSEGDKVPIIKYKTIDGYKYCFTVPSGMWIMRRNNKIAITGNSGKSLSVDHIKEVWNINMIESRTTRDRRTPDETGHTFVTEAEFDTYKCEDMIAFTTFGTARYCCLKSDVENRNIYVIDESGLTYLRDNFSKEYNIFSIRIHRDENVRRLSVGEERIERDKGKFTMPDSNFDEVITHCGHREELYDKLDEIISRNMLYI